MKENEFKSRLKSLIKPVSIEYNFKWNQSYLSRGLNSLNSASVLPQNKIWIHSLSKDRQSR